MLMITIKRSDLNLLLSTEKIWKLTTLAATKLKLPQLPLTETIIIKILPKRPHVTKKTRAMVPIKKNLPKMTSLTMQNLCSLADTRGLKPWHQLKPFQENILNKRRNLSELFTPNARDMQGLAICNTKRSDRKST